MTLLPKCICGSADFIREQIYGLPMLVCSCGVQRQDVQMTAEELHAWYESYHSGHYTHSFEHDLKVGHLRINQYGDFLEAPVLDVGCGNGGFVAACRSSGIVAEGQDISGEADYFIALEDICGYFQTITMHDVLEHVPDPVAMLKEVRRLGNRLIVDFPSFHEPDGLHHWKPIEHLWMLTESQLLALLRESGFKVVRKERPIPGKLTVFCE